MPTPTISWAVDADGDWSNTADWSPSRLPDATDDVAINTTDLHTVTHSTGADSVNSLTVGNDDFVVSGGSLAIASSASFANLLTVSGGTLAFGSAPATAAGFVQSGGTVSGTGTLTVTGSASFGSTASETGAGTTLVEGAASLAAGAVLNLTGGRKLTLTGTGSVLAGAVKGGGKLTFAGGTQTLSSGASLVVNHWTINGGATTTLGEDVTYTHDFSQAASTIDLAGHTLTLTGPTTFGGLTQANASMVNGGGNLITRGPTSVTYLFIGGAATWTNYGFVTETGPAYQGAGGANFVNQSTGVLDVTGDTSLLVKLFVNDGLAEKTGGTGQTDFGDRIVNNGTIEVSTGTLILTTVTGSGACIIAGGTLGFSRSGVNESPNVTFSGSSGTLLLSVSRAYTGMVSGFSTTGGTEFILQDISFVSANEATFSGNASGGVLTVVGGKFTAHINLVGDYLGATFTAISGGRETIVVATSPASPAAPSPHRFAAAIAGFAAPPATSASPAGGADWLHQTILATPARHAARIDAA